MRGRVCCCWRRGVNGVDAQGEAVENSGRITFEGTAAITLTGGNVRLISDAAAASALAASGNTPARNMANITVTASRNVILNAQLRAGQFAITAADQLRIANINAVNLTSNSASVGNIILQGVNAPSFGSQNITINAALAVILRSSVLTTGNLTIATAGSSVLGSAAVTDITLAGNNINLLSGGGSLLVLTGSDRSLTVQARGNLTIGGSMGSGGGNLDLTLEAGFGTTTNSQTGATAENTGKIDFRGTAAITLDGRDVSITSDAEPVGDTARQASVQYARNQ